jgi:hypothetical protein
MNALYLFLGIAILPIPPIAIQSEQPDASQIVFLEKQTCHFFGAFDYTAARFLALLKDSTYVAIDRQHMYVGIDDRGRWAQQEDGTVSLHSKIHYRNLEYGPLRVFLWYDGPGKLLEDIRSALSTFLDTHKAADFLSDEVTRIYEYESPVVDGMMLEGIKVEYDVRRVSRSDLKTLLLMIETYMRSSDVGTFRFIPMKHAKTVFLHWVDGYCFQPTDLEKLLQDVNEAQQNDPPVPPYIHIQMSAEQFEREASTTEPFRFVTEMNQRPKPVLGEVQLLINRCRN